MAYNFADFRISSPSHRPEAGDELVEIQGGLLAQLVQLIRHLVDRVGRGGRRWGAIEIERPSRQSAGLSFYAGLGGRMSAAQMLTVQVLLPPPKRPSGRQPGGGHYRGHWRGTEEMRGAEIGRRVDFSDGGGASPFLLLGIPANLMDPAIRRPLDGMPVGARTSDDGSQP